MDSEWTEQRVADLIGHQMQESLNLEYKGSAALTPKTDSVKRELCKDVSSFANAAGGTIIYGVAEEGTPPVPTRIDGGLDPSVVSREWIEQVLNSAVHPRLSGLRITQVPLSGTFAGSVLYAIDIPQATALAPHQANDYRYYKRYNFQAIMMEDYEVRDAFRRSESPDLYCTFGFTNGEIVLLFPSNLNQQGRQFHNTHQFDIKIGNRAAEPAQHAVCEVMVDLRLATTFSISGLPKEDMVLLDGRLRKVRCFTLYWPFHLELPIFRGVDHLLFPNPVYVTLPVHYPYDSEHFVIACTIHAPRMQSRTDVAYIQDDGHLATVVKKLP